MAVLLLAAWPGIAGAGDLCLPLPLEGWALVGRWHVGSAARSVREGWLQPAFRANEWAKVSAGGWLPRSASGCWLRARFQLRKALWTTVGLDLAEVPSGTRAFINGVEVRWTATVAGAPADVSSLVRSGENVLVLVTPSIEARIAKAPRASLAGISSSGRERTAPVGPPWRCRADQVEAAIPPAWLRSSDTSVWRVSLPRPPAAADDWLPRAPLCVKAVLNLPPQWRGRRFSVFLHGLAGSPEVWLNGERVAGPVVSPVRVDLGKKMNFDGRDVLCLLYPEPPAGGGNAGQWGVAALRWDANVPLPRFPSGSALVFDPGAWAGQEGVRQALAFAAGAASVSATPWAFSWLDAAAPAPTTATGTGTGVPAAGLVVAAWGATAYREADFPAFQEEASRRLARWNERARRAWVLVPPALGKRADSSRNERLRVYNKSVRNLARSAGAGFIPAYDVFRSALRRSRRWPVRADLTDDEGTLGPQGACLLGLVILDAFSAP